MFNIRKETFKKEILFYMLFVGTLSIIFFTSPFLKYPFDMYVHLLMIDDYFTNPYKIIDQNPPYWHHFWARLFHLFGIDNSQIFLRAQIIHITQSIISFISVFYFSKILIGLLYKKIDNTEINYLAYWSTFIWFTIFATFSEGYHQIWIAWYSLSYQITLPLTLVVMALTLTLLKKKLSRYGLFIHLILISFFSFIILAIHSMEYIYFLLYLFILTILHLSKVISFYKKHTLLFITTLIGMGFFFIKIHEILQLVSYREPPFLQYMSFEKLPLLWEKIIQDGNLVVNQLSRSYASFNELYYVSIFLISLLLMVTHIRRYYLHKETYLNNTMLWFIFITTLFVFIPITSYTAGLFAIITHVNLINRFYYSSLLFVVIPISVYYILLLFQKKNLITINIFIPLVLLFVFIYSRYDIAHSQNYYKNIQSLKDMFNKEKVGFQLSKEQISTIGLILNKYYKTHHKQKLYFYAREDIAFILKYVYQQDVFLPKHWNGRGIDLKNYINTFKLDTKGNKVLFDIPEDFPDYIPYR